MPTTYAHMFPTVTDLDLKLRHLAATERGYIDVVSSVVTPDHVAADYVYNAGLGNDRATFAARRDYDRKKNISSASFRVSTKLRKTISETGVVLDLPIEAGVFWNYGGEYLESIAEMNEVIQIAMGTLFFTLTGANGTPTTIVVSNFDRGVINALY